jgi:SAM-dependent methyltransferase
VRTRRKALWHALIRSRLPYKSQLLRAYLRLQEYRRSRSAPDEQPDDGTVALPPARLRVLVTGVAGREAFLRSGRAQTNYLRAILDEVGRPMSDTQAILDFGCGCGRMTRWWQDLTATEIHGCDYNPTLVRWCQQNLTFARASATKLKPPLPYRDGKFDFIYAFSVFTHMSVDLACEWIAEFARATKPGGLVWFSVHGASYRQRLLPEQKKRFDAGEIVVWFPEIQGTNLCAAYWPHAAVSQMFDREFEVLLHLDPLAEPAAAQAAEIAPHDGYLVRRR